MSITLSYNNLFSLSACLLHYQTTVGIQPAHHWEKKNVNLHLLHYYTNRIHRKSCPHSAHYYPNFVSHLCFYPDQVMAFTLNIYTFSIVSALPLDNVQDTGESVYTQCFGFYLCSMSDSRITFTCTDHFQDSVQIQIILPICCTCKCTFMSFWLLCTF